MGFVTAFSVDVPFWDQWRLVPLFDKVATGTVTFGDFWALHSNHRLLFPKIIITILAFTSHWNINYEICFSIFLSILTFGFLYKISETTSKGVSDRLFHLTNISTCFLLFSLVQEQNWLWGFQLAWFLINLCVISAVYWLNSDSQLAPNLRIFLAGMACLVASLSSAHGLLSWLAVIPSLFAVEGTVKQRTQRLLGWVSIWVALLAIYTIDYHPKNGSPKIGSLLEQPLVLGDYFFSLIGAPIVRLPMVSALIGLVIFCSFLGVIFYIFNRYSFKLLAAIIEVAPWLSIGLFSILCSALITMGRVRYGVEQALDSSRYTTTSLLLLIAFVQIFLVLFSHNWEEFKLKTKPAYTIFLFFLWSVITVNSLLEITQAQAALPYKKSRETCLKIINYLDESPFHKSKDSCIALLSEKTWLIREGAEILDRIGFRKFPKDVAFITNSSKKYGYLDSPQTAEKPLVVKSSDRIRVAGWAILPEQRQPPTLVLLSYADQKLFFANAYVTLDSPDVAKALNSNLYRRVRWAVTFSANSLPIGETVINAWVYNPDGKQFVKLKGEAQVKVEAL